MEEGYFKRFCSSIDKSEQCQVWAEETEQGSRTQENLYELLIGKYGEEAVAQAHVDAMRGLDVSTTTKPQQEEVRDTAAQAQKGAVQRQTTNTSAPAQMPATTKQEGEDATKEAIMEKVQELQKEKEEERNKKKAQRRTAENEQRARVGLSTPKQQPPPQSGGGHIPAAPSEIEDICRVCVTPPTIAILEVLKLWYSGDDAKFIEDIVDKVGNEDILIEEALAQVFIKDKNSLDGIERTLQDFNKVLEEALRIAASKSPELKARFDREREELEGTEGVAATEQEAGSGEGDG